MNQHPSEFPQKTVSADPPSPREAWVKILQMSGVRLPKSRKWRRRRVVKRFVQELRAEASREKVWPR